MLSLLCLIALSLLGCTIVNGESPSAPPELAPLLTEFVRADGVRYKEWKSDPTALKALDNAVNFFAKGRPPDDHDAALAWYLNAYNTNILHQVLQHYPVEGPLAISETFFNDDSIIIAGERMSFDRLESQRIRATFADPRIHFALNCASGSCPRLQSHPFQAQTLDADLNRVTKEFLEDPERGVSASGGKVLLSRIFDWYADDFGGRQALLPFVNKHLGRQIPQDGTIGFLDYNWDLNETLLEGSGLRRAKLTNDQDSK